jgi:Na+-translocating ferredoxin:NAD+ oxidoreductase RnfG subunit
MREIFKPVLILLVICVIISFCVSLVFNVTDDTIQEMERKANELLMSAVLPDAKPFTEIKDWI